MRIVGTFRKLTQDSFTTEDGEKIAYANISVLDEDTDEVVKVKPFTSDPEDMADLVEFVSGLDRGDRVALQVKVDGKGNVRFRRALT